MLSTIAKPLAGAVIALALIGCGSHRSARYVEPTVPAGVRVRQSAAHVEGRILRGLDPGARITSVRIFRTRDDFWHANPDKGEPVGAEAHGGPVWLVRAYGHFQLVTVPPGGKPVTGSRSGYVVVDDATGRTLAYGFSGPRA